MREKGKIVKDFHFEKWLVCNIQRLISIKVLKTQFKQGMCMSQICVYVWGWDESLGALSVCQVNQLNYVCNKLMSGQAQRL